MPLVQVFLYGAVVFFAVAVVVRSLRYARAPVHLRWELYPVAHERGRAHYGGSVFEEPEWWRHDRSVDHGGAARAMAAEILLLEGVRRHNPGLWLRSWLFHLGMYLLIGWVLANLAGGVAIAAGVGPDGALRQVALIASAGFGFAGLGAGVAGGLGLLARRCTDPGLRAYNTRADFLNLGVFIVWMTVALIAHAAEGGFASLHHVAAALVGFAPASPSAPVAVELALGGLILVWLPLSRMFHFVAKYFLYHRVRWEDAPNPRGGPLERRLQQAMSFGVGWSAPHATGARSWGEAASRKEQQP